MKREANSPEAYEDVIRSVVASNKTVTNNDQILTSIVWININFGYCIDTCLTVLYHQHQNYCEGVGGNLTFVVIKLFHNNPFSPLSYRCCAVSFLDNTRIFLSKSSTDERCGHELIKGKTGDISIFIFYWFEPIWFYNPQSSFSKDKMEAGFFLNLTDDTGDNLSYIILPVKY